MKLLAALPSVHRDEAERVRQRVYIDPQEWFGSEEPITFLPILQQAVWEDREIRMIYQRRDGTISERLLWPYALVAKSNIWYVVARQSEGGMRSFRVSRCRDVTLTGKHFERERDFDLVAYWKASQESFEQQLPGFVAIPCTVIMRAKEEHVWYFSSAASGYFERVSEPDEEGYVLLKVHFHSQWQALNFSLSLIGEVEVLEPSELRYTMVEKARMLLKTYGGEE